MASALVAGASSSCSTAFTRSHSITTTNTPPKLYTPSQCLKTTFQGQTLEEAKRGITNSFVVEKNSNFNISRRDLAITARTAKASNIEVEVDKPLGLTLGPKKSGGGVVITGIESGGNAAKSGLKIGDQVIYTSSFFGDELWPADKLGFTKTAIQAKPDSVYFVVSRGVDVDVKRLPKRPAPPRFGRKLTEAQKARATHICLDCGFIYFLPKPFEEQPETYICPQCSAPKKRFAGYDANTGKPIGGGLPPIGVIIGLVAGIGGVGALLVYGLQ